VTCGALVLILPLGKAEKLSVEGFFTDPLTVCCLVNWSCLLQTWGLTYKLTCMWASQGDKDLESGTMCHTLGDLQPGQALEIFLPSTVTHGALQEHQHFITRGCDQWLTTKYHPKTGPHGVQRWRISRQPENTRGATYKSGFGSSFEKLKDETTMGCSFRALWWQSSSDKVWAYPLHLTYVCDPPDLCMHLALYPVRCSAAILDPSVRKPSSMAYFLHLLDEGFWAGDFTSRASVYFLWNSGSTWLIDCFKFSFLSLKKKKKSGQKNT
jgi:hypothetical protein